MCDRFTKTWALSYLYITRHNNTLFPLFQMKKFIFKMMNFKPIETERLILRPVTMDDAQDFFEMDSNPNVHKYLGNNPVKTIEQSKAWIEDILEQEALVLGSIMQNSERIDICDLTQDD